LEKERQRKVELPNESRKSKIEREREREKGLRARRISRKSGGRKKTCFETARQANFDE
jgi:hypothetical protein